MTQYICNVKFLLVVVFSILYASIPFNAFAQGTKWRTIFSCDVPSPTTDVTLTTKINIQSRRSGGLQRYRQITQFTCVQLDEEDNCISEDPQKPESILGTIRRKRAIFQGKDFDLRITLAGRQPYSATFDFGSSTISPNASCIKKN